MPTSWDSMSPIFSVWQLYGSREISVSDNKMDKFKFNGKDGPSCVTSSPEDSFAAVGQDNVESSGHTPEDSKEVASSENDPDSGDDSVSSQESTKGSKIPCVSSLCCKGVPVHGGKPYKKVVHSGSSEQNQLKRWTAVLIFVFCCFPCATGQSPRKDCWDKRADCSQYRDNDSCKPGLDANVNVTWFHLHCQKTCICDKLAEDRMDKETANCTNFQYNRECLQRPPAEVFRKSCASTCYYSRTPDLEGFQTSPKDQTTKEGMNTSFECSINSTNPRANFTWFKNNIPIRPDERVSVYSNSYASNLTIVWVTALDEGKYHCRATNSDYGEVLSVNSSEAILSMEKDLEGFQTSPKDQTTKEGTNTSFECSINSTNPRANFTWFKNNIPIRPDERVSVYSNSYASNLTIVWVTALDEGKYHCRATNSDYGEVLSVNSSEAILSMEKDLEGFQTSPKDQTTKEGTNTSFECSINSTNPRANFTWFKNNIPIRPDERVSVYSNSYASNLTIVWVTALDEGKYHCRATNSDYGEVLSVNSSEAILSMEKDLEGFQTSPKDQTTKEGTNTSFECSINSTNPRANFTWFKNNIPIRPDERVSVYSNSYASNLTIVWVTALDEGKYHCRATNSDYGEVLSVNSSEAILSMEKGTNTSSITGPVLGVLLFLVVVAVVGAMVV
ncbi:peroxidasin homolog isoform X1 [Haliotis asinina]|uniref:peroxidasin homolog isoform X1 n=1 Tax=Haliotis asinina TaxID=109174 RepID=UPI003531ADD7